MRRIRASELKAKCLAILDEIARTGESVTILKRGRPIASLVPLRLEKESTHSTLCAGP